MRLTDELLSKIHFKKGPNGDLAYLSATLKPKSNTNENATMAIDKIPEKSIKFLCNVNKSRFFYLFTLIFIFL